MSEILKSFSSNVRAVLEKEDISKTEEIRLRVSRPITLKNNSEERILEYNATTEDILQTLQLICDNSIYSYQNQICNGFITVSGGHRVGISRNSSKKKKKSNKHKLHIKYKF